MESVYYFPGGYWIGKAAISKLAASANVSRYVAIWQIFLNPPKAINTHFDVNVPNEVHQTDILFLPHDAIKTGRRQHTDNALTVVDVASIYKESLSTKTASKVASSL